jgi:hypothetical protein
MQDLIQKITKATWALVVECLLSKEENQTKPK